MSRCVCSVRSEWTADVHNSIVDIHSHLGVNSSPELRGADDTNSVKGIAQPWLRSLDGINTHDEAYALSVSGGVTTSVILPGKFPLLLLVCAMG